VLDITQIELPIKYFNAATAILSIFCLSAVHPECHLQSFANLYQITKPDGYVLFRDYGLCDCTMLRHKRRLGERLFQRCDGTLCYYFSLEDVAALAVQTGFRVLELNYACVTNRNRKKDIAMNRVFVHCVLFKPINDVIATCR
jgi:methyltransferase-like protein 6